MKTYPNGKACIKAWAEGFAPEGKCGNISFRDGKLYSYAACIGAHTRPGFVLSTRKYSPTTSRHQSWARLATLGREVRFSDEFLTL